jgi:hypothetical protein
LGYTRRDGKGSVHFHVDTRFGLTKFVDDWTVYHELAHMALPYLGSEYRWFSEGFASFMQYQIMQKHNTTLIELIAHYQDCCRGKDNNLTDVVASLDGILNDTLFSHLLKRYESDPARELYPESFE